MICGSHVEGAGSSMRGAGSFGGGMQVPIKELQQGKVSVWWDIENCPIPKNYSNLSGITCNIIKALRGLGYLGEISINVCGNTKTLSLEVQNVLKSTGVSVIHTPSGKDAADKKIITNMMFWGYGNPPPASYLLISGDIDFMYALEKTEEPQFQDYVSGSKIYLRNFSYNGYCMGLGQIITRRAARQIVDVQISRCAIVLFHPSMVMLSVTSFPFVVSSTLAIRHWLVDIMIHLFK